MCHASSLRNTLISSGSSKDGTWPELAVLVEQTQSFSLFTVLLFKEFTMLTRRNAILASTAFAVGAANQSSHAASTSTPQSQLLPSSHMDVVVTFTAEHASYQCLQCAESASRCITVAARSADANVGEFVQVCQDASDICFVTATILTRQGPLSPAICQACADACDRLIYACANANLNGLEQTCATLANRCATVCRRLVNKIAEA